MPSIKRREGDYCVIPSGGGSDQIQKAALQLSVFFVSTTFRASSRCGNKKPQVTACPGFHLRREGDSNPRYVSVNTLSKRARSATLPPLRFSILEWGRECNEKLQRFIARSLPWGQFLVLYANIGLPAPYCQAADLIILS